MTILVVSYLILVFFFFEVWMKWDYEYNVILFFGILHALVTGTFIWYIWKKLPCKKKTKINDTLMVFFLGVIGMWIWLPSNNEIKKLVDGEGKKIEP